MMPSHTPDNPDSCPRCGSTHFHLATFTQYSVFPGGGYQPRSEHSHQAIVCLCGQPISVEMLNPRTKKARTHEGQSSLDSVKSADDYRWGTGPKQLVRKLGRDFITHAEFQALSDQVSALETILQQLRKEDQENDQKTPG